MNARSLASSIVTCAFSLAIAGCPAAPGKPASGAAAIRPDQVADFTTLYQGNCAGCHGDSGKNGAAISLSNPVYLKTAGFDNMLRVTANGVPGTLMPGFSKQAGGFLTDTQLAILVHGMVDRWGKPASPGATPTPYASDSPGSPAQGQIVFLASCAPCHGQGGDGAAAHSGSIVDPTYLALISDQGLRSIIIAGMPEQGMPAARADLMGSAKRSLTDQQITDIVAWLSSLRSPAPGQPYPTHHH